MKNIKRYFILIMMFMIISSSCIVVKPQYVYAADPYIGDISYTEYRELDEMFSQIIAVSNNQRAMYNKTIAKWDNYTVNDQERYEDINKYIIYTESNVKFISKYSATSSKRIANTTNVYVSDLKEFAGKNYKDFYNKGVIYLDYILLNADYKIWYNQYINFKNNEIKNFLNNYIYTNDNRVAIKSISDKDSSKKQQGITSLKNNVSRIQSVKNDKGTSNIIKGLAGELIVHYNKIIEGKPTDISHFTNSDYYRVQGLSPIGNVYDEIKEFNPYVLKFNNFADFPSKSLATQLSSKDIDRLVKMQQSFNTTTTATNRLRKEHYNLLFAIHNYNNKQQSSIDNEYENLFKYYHYMQQYYTSIQAEYGVDVSSDMVISEISQFKSKIECLDTKMPDNINKLQYKQNYTKDTNEYRQFANGGSNIITKILIIIAIVVVVIVVGFVILKFIQKRNNNSGYEDDNNNYYY